MAASGPPPPVRVTLSTDKSDYVEGEVVALTAVVVDEAGDSIGGPGVVAFVTMLDIEWVASLDPDFTETEVAGTYTANLNPLPDNGNHTVSVTATVGTDSGEDTTGFTVSSAPMPGSTVSIDGITYSTSGGKNGNKHLNDTLTLVDDVGNPVSGAGVSVTLTNTTTSAFWSGSGATDSNGSVTFTLKNAPSGCYSTTIDNVTASGLTWDDVTPLNGHNCK